jgi:hypothetical protein
MKEERKRILDMLESGKITSDEAEKLLDALSNPDSHRENNRDTEAVKDPKFIYVKVTSTDNDNVDVKIPLGLIRAGMRLTSLIPPQAMNHINESMEKQGMSIDLNNLKQDDIEELIKNLTEMEVNVNTKSGDNVKVYCA